MAKGFSSTMTLQTRNKHDDDWFLITLSWAYLKSSIFRGRISSLPLKAGAGLPSARAAARSCYQFNTSDQSRKAYIKIHLVLKTTNQISHIKSGFKTKLVSEPLKVDQIFCSAASCHLDKLLWKITQEWHWPKTKGPFGSQVHVNDCD